MMKKVIRIPYCRVLCFFFCLFSIGRIVRVDGRRRCISLLTRNVLDTSIFSEIHIEFLKVYAEI